MIISNKILRIHNIYVFFFLTGLGGVHVIISVLTTGRHSFLPFYFFEIPSVATFFTIWSLQRNGGLTLPLIPTASKTFKAKGSSLFVPRDLASTSWFAEVWVCRRLNISYSLSKTHLRLPFSIPPHTIAGPELWVTCRV